MAEIGKVQYCVNFFHECEQRAADWRWPDKTLARWTESCRDSSRWCPDGELTEEGRGAILGHFGLEDAAGTLPLRIIRAMPLDELLGERRRLERLYSLERLEPVNDRAGGHIFAEGVV